MATISAGILPYRLQEQAEFFLVHPGGPYWVNKQDGAWGIAKGIVEPGENLKNAALREFREETGFEAVGDLIELTPRRLPSGKLVYAWGILFDCDPSLAKSNTFEMEWPPKSGRIQTFPEIDRAEWFPLAQALQKISKGQLGFIEELNTYIQ